MPCSFVESLQSHVARQVADTTIVSVRVSTVFLSLNHNYSGSDRSLVFETMIFGGRLDEYYWRWSTYEEAEKGHAEVVNLLQAEQDELDRLYHSVPEG